LIVNDERFDDLDIGSDREKRSHEIFSPAAPSSQLYPLLCAAHGLNCTCVHDDDKVSTRAGKQSVGAWKESQAGLTTAWRAVGLVAEPR
jgi:hypothetical protein